MSLKVKHQRQTFNITCWHKKLILYTIIGLHCTLISREPVLLFSVGLFTSIRLTIHPPLPPRLPLRLVYTQKYLNVFECTQPYFVLLQETLNFFSLLSMGGPRPPGPPLATPLTGYAAGKESRETAWWFGTGMMIRTPAWRKTDRVAWWSKHVER